MSKDFIIINYFMKKWNIIIEYLGRELEIKIEANYYSDAYVKAELKYPGCRILSISEIAV
jgi:hypothetical protein